MRTIASVPEDAASSPSSSAAMECTSRASSTPARHRSVRVFVSNARSSDRSGSSRSWRPRSNTARSSPRKRDMPRAPDAGSLTSTGSTIEFGESTTRRLVGASSVRLQSEANKRTSERYLVAALVRLIVGRRGQVGTLVDASCALDEDVKVVELSRRMTHLGEVPCQLAPVLVPMVHDVQHDRPVGRVEVDAVLGVPRHDGSERFVWAGVDVLDETGVLVSPERRDRREIR